jgi:hypothetical protein
MFLERWGAAVTADIIIDETWPRMLRALRQQEGKTVAAIAYVTKQLLELRRGDTLVCDASEGMVKAGQTDPKVLLAYLRKGVSVRSHPGLHAKAMARGQVAIVGSANSSNTSADGQLSELVALLRDRPAVSATRQRIETLARRSMTLDPVTLERLVRMFRPARQFRPRRRRARARTVVKTRAWCIGTYFIDEHPTIEEARERGTSKAQKSAQSLLGKRWHNTYRIDDDVSWSPGTVKAFELGDNIFDVLENKTLRPPGVLVHVEPSDGRHGSVLFICRERKHRSRGMKHVRTQTDQGTYRMLRRAAMRQLSPRQLDRVNQLFGS